MLIYLATPIDFAHRDKNPLLFQQREGVVRLLQACGHVVYSPSSAFAVAGTPDPSLQDLNWAALERSDAVLAMLPANCVSIGVPMELGFAKALNIPAAVLTDHTRSWALAGFDRFPVEGLDGARRAVAKLECDYARSTGRSTPLFFTVDEGGSLPDRAYDDDAGLDLYAQEDAVVVAGETATLHTGVAVELPRTHWAMIHGRSSTLRRGLRVETGIIDPGYRGELLIMATNMDRSAGYAVTRGTKLAQLILLPAANRFAPAKVEMLSSSQDGRGANGFGSSGGHA